MATKRDAQNGRTTTTKPTKPAGKRTWKLLDRAATVVAGMMATRATAVAWRGISGKRPPRTGTHPEVSTREATLWAFFGGGIAELVRTGVHRGMANYWMRSTGELPPGMKPLVTRDPEPEAPEEEPSQRKRRKSATK